MSIGHTLSDRELGGLDEPLDVLTSEDNRLALISLAEHPLTEFSELSRKYHSYSHRISFETFSGIVNFVTWRLHQCFFLTT